MAPGHCSASLLHDGVAFGVFEYDELECVENVVGVNEEVRRLWPNELVFTGCQLDSLPAGVDAALAHELERPVRLDSLGDVGYSLVQGLDQGLISGQALLGEHGLLLPALL